MYFEFLKLMNHYGLLDKDTKQKWKDYLKEAEQSENEDSQEN